MLPMSMRCLSGVDGEGGCLLLRLCCFASCLYDFAAEVACFVSLGLEWLVSGYLPNGVNAGCSSIVGVWRYSIAM